MADVPHYCSACGEIHGGGSSRESEELKIAKLNADRDIRIAEIQRSERRVLAEAGVETTEVQAEAEIAVAEVQAGAAVDEAVVENEVLEEIVAPDEPEPVVIPVAAPAGGAEEETSGPPEIAPASQSSGKSAGFWDNYH